ncbi:glycosyltransferase family 2 protein [Empedobacter falsenii]|uniref:glycosyltransferase family 2 protein n=1 Tax=Empedobacter falsenii TaxID=343874 RepID=UPI001C598B87|nr:glycosyltransferase family A protein [Empedobacter falsenii]MBW1619337.1 glycosyltransferase family 2 protein [Empedobacter falsenii]
MITIFTPTYNRAYILPQLFESLLNQTNKNFEWLIVDDGSTDHTEQVLENYIEKDKRFKFYHRPDYLVKSGNSCRNYGFEKSKGELVAFF